MTDREKAIRILEGNYKSFVLRHNGELLTVNELIALLKAKQPRVMTDADFIDNPNMDSQGFLPAWLEYRRDGEWAEYWDDTEDEWANVTADNFRGEGYRCWTARPDEKVRAETPWQPQ